MFSKISDRSWWIFIHNKSEPISAYEWNGIYLKYNYIYTLTYNVKTYQLLPNPYPTDCMFYEKQTKFKSRKDCIRRCKISEALNKCGGLSDDMDVYSGEPNVSFVLSWNDFYCVRNLRLNEFCPKKCRHYDCFKQHMEHIIIQDKPNPPKMIVHHINHFISFSPKTTFYHQPCTETVEFLCYLASTLGLWFGFSLLSVKDLFIANFFKNISYYFIRRTKSNIVIVKNFKLIFQP